MKKPREFEKGAEQSQIFAKTNKLVQLPPDPNLFQGLVFYLDITHDGNSKHTSFMTSIEELGGKISRRLDKNVTHLIWQEGSIDTIGKALQYEQLHIVSSLWLKDCETEMQRLDEEKYKPVNLESKMREARAAKIQTVTRQLNRTQ